MYKIDSLTLISGIDIPIPELGVNIHQPTIREIAYIGEQRFYMSAQIMTLTVENYARVNSEILKEEDKTALSQMSNFQLIMTMVSGDNNARLDLTTLLTLLFPQYLINIEERFIMLVEANKKQTIMLDENNFSVLQDVIKIILCLRSGNTEEEFNPMGERAREIAEKIQRGRDKVAKLSNKKAASNFLSKYISGLGIGTKSLNIINVLDLTLYQLFDQIERYSLRESYETSIKAKLAGAKDVEDVDWLKDIEK